MPGSVLGVVVSELSGIFKTGVEEMLQAKLAGQFIKAGTPIDLSLFSNSKTIGVGEKV